MTCLRTETTDCHVPSADRPTVSAEKACGGEGDNGLIGDTKNKKQKTKNLSERGRRNSVKNRGTARAPMTARTDRERRKYDCAIDNLVFLAYPFSLSRSPTSYLFEKDARRHLQPKL